MLLPPLLYFCQYVLEYGVVVFHAVIQVDTDHLVGEMIGFFFVVVQFFRLGLNSGKAFLELYCSR